MLPWSINRCLVIPSAAPGRMKTVHHFVLPYYPEEGLFDRPRYWLCLFISLYIFGFLFVVWRWFFFTSLLEMCKFHPLPTNSVSIISSGWTCPNNLYPLLFPISVPSKTQTFASFMNYLLVPEIAISFFHSFF